MAAAQGRLVGFYGGKNMAKKRAKKKTGTSGRLIFIAAVFTFLMALLCLRVGWIQIVRGRDLSRQALDQQTSDNTVSAKRGNIYDRNYKILASNITVESISVSPDMVRTSIEDNGLSTDMVAKSIADILGMDMETVKDKISKHVQSETLKKKVDKEIHGMDIR